MNTLPCPCWETPQPTPGQYIVQRPPAINPAKSLRIVCRLRELTAKIQEAHPRPTSLAAAAASLPFTPPIG